MRRLIFSLAFVFCMALPAMAQALTGTCVQEALAPEKGGDPRSGEDLRDAGTCSAESEGMDMQKYLFGHVGDSYGWHITTVKGKHVTVHLPVIVRSRTSGWHVFSSRHIEEGEEYEGFRIAADGQKHAGKLVEILPDGSAVKPMDISVTKNVLGLMINSLLVLLLVLLAARWYRRHDAREEVPKGFAGLMEMMVMMVEDDIIRPCVGRDYRRYSPYLLTAFFFIFVNN